MPSKKNTKQVLEKKSAKQKYSAEDIHVFLYCSNLIEQEYSDEALEDAKKAWEYLWKLRNKPLKVEHILECHRILMERIDPAIAGKIRNGDVYIGGRRCVFISEQLISDDLKWKVAMPMNVNDGEVSSVKKREEFAKNVHIAFEYVHPFFDGNGRTGRLLMLLHRWRLGLPILIIHPGKEQMEYYQWFKEAK